MKSFTVCICGVFCYHTLHPCFWKWTSGAARLSVTVSVFARVLGGLPTYRDVAPEFGHIIVIGAEELGEPADGPLAAFVHRLISLKVLVVFVDRVVGQMHVELALWREKGTIRGFLHYTCLFYISSLI